MNSLFADAVPDVHLTLPAGFIYESEFLSPSEEAEILKVLAGLELSNSRYHEYTALRRTSAFRLPWNAADADSAPDGDAAIPDVLVRLVSKVAAHYGFPRAAIPHLLVTEYPPGAPMGWHRDAPPCAEIFGVSLGSSCRFRLRPMSVAGPEATAAERRRASIALTVEPRSLYCMTGPARSDWQHAVSPVRQLRFSITLRTLTRQVKTISKS